MGQMAATGASFCTEPPSNSGECVASGLVLAFGAFDCVIDNAGCFSSSVLPENGYVIHFGEHRVFVAIVPEFPAEVHACSDRLPEEAAGYESRAGLRNYAECMVTFNSDRPEASRTAAARGSVEALVEDLTTPITPDEDPEATTAPLKLTRQHLIDSANNVASTQRRVEAQVREFNTVHNFTPVTVDPSRMGN